MRGRSFGRSLESGDRTGGRHARDDFARRSCPDRRTLILPRHLFASRNSGLPRPVLLPSKSDVAGICLNPCSGRVDDCGFRQMLGEIQARCANPAVGHAVVDVETVWCAEVVAAIDASGKDDIGDRSAAFLR